MAALLRFCLVLVLLTPSLAYAAVLENPSGGNFYSGIGVISGWKCEVNGELTVRFDGGRSIPLLYGSERLDTRSACGDANNGFVAIWNWARLDDGEHTAVVYDNGMEFDRATFEVATLGEEFVVGVVGECTVSDFPSPGETTTLEWNQATQHLEVVREGPQPPRLHPSDAPANLPQVATVAGLNSSASGTIEAGGDVDYYRREVLQEGVVIVETEGNTDTVGHLRASDGRWLDMDDDGGEDGNFQLKSPLPVGTYYVRMSGSADTETGPYTLRIRYGNSFLSEDDHADSPERATEFPTPALDNEIGTVYQPISVELTHGDVDYLKYTAVQRGRIFLADRLEKYRIPGPGTDRTGIPAIIRSWRVTPPVRLRGVGKRAEA